MPNNFKFGNNHSSSCENEHARLAEAVEKFLEVYSPESFDDMPTILEFLTKRLLESKNSQQGF